ncbi:MULTISPECIES: CcdB family protein [Marivita]|uniref:Toxin CcdB n=1 Tax=Marivita cryptomonadis TaxID=505252 RepID=A0A9Q2S1G0_9RHOB|nr:MULTISPECIES: CcdB family protein [Marivita]MCR9167980.1 CcdB family protein [Paracoccaceae bacterium]MBM2321360.1 CcdB family protein [Marivita cryptomonadis]MBM2330941.1 CcdB family protein [Marivita cryptomonadis]MBM2340527.1 CcdB family protein [Marivita cryptomonadis]MBM2345189.1 CcdB family protein [Marivita cryptomonadis]
MAQQFDVFRTDSGSHVLVLQSDLLADANTRVVSRLVPEDWSHTPIDRLSPRIVVGDLALRLNLLQLATLTLPQLETHIGSAAHQRDDIIRACDMLLTGY